jgi:hypothetical protein
LAYELKNDTTGKIDKNKNGLLEDNERYALSNTSDQDTNNGFLRV